MKSITLTRPDDFHIHLREGLALSRTVSDASRQFTRAIVMPNLVKPIVDVSQALAYREQIIQAIPNDHNFTPLLTLYLTDKTSIATIKQAKQCPFVFACKLYPAGSTTHSQAGVSSIEHLYPIFKAMQAMDLPLLIHGETPLNQVDIFDREQYFIDTELITLVKNFPKLKIVLEHISTHYAVEFVKQCPATVAATITAHHLLLNRNDIFAGGIQPHHYCLPILKRQRDQHALITAATSGNPKFFLGTDSAPHSQTDKESACGCAGIYTARFAIELYAEAFEQADALPRLEAFSSHFGADFYQLERSKEKIILENRPQAVPKTLDLGGKPLIPFRAGTQVTWSLVEPVSDSN